VRDSVPRRPDGPFTVGCLSRLAPWKGHGLVLRAFAQAFPTGPQRLRILGAGWFGEQDVAEQLRRDAAELGVEDRVDLVGHRHDVAAELAGIDVVVAYSRTAEPFGQVVVDALTAGRPVVAAAEGGPAETLRHDVDGLLVPPRDPAALAGALRRLHDEPELRGRLAREGRATAQRYTPDRLGEALAGVYHEVLA
jgi:glycosyltransferase involved in cell wall biosynthesis